MRITPSEFLYFPTKNGKWLRDSQCKPRVYKSPRALLTNLKPHEYDHIQIYACDDVVTKEEFERLQDLIEEAQQYNDAWVADNGKLRKEAKNIKADAVKEFAERVKEKIRTMSRIVVYDEDIDKLVKEFTEGG